jgi:hypothetical protein
MLLRKRERGLGVRRLLIDPLTDDDLLAALLALNLAK